MEIDADRMSQKRRSQIAARLNSIDAVFYRTDPLLYHVFENVVTFRYGFLNSICSPGNQHYQKIIHFSFFFHQKRAKSTIQKLYFYWNQLKLLINRDIINLIYNIFWLSNFDPRFRTFLMNKLKINNFLIMLVSWATK